MQDDRVSPTGNPRETGGIFTAKGPGTSSTVELSRRIEELQRELAEALKREMELRGQVASVQSASSANHQFRRAALNLMEDAIAARRAEQQEYAERLRAENAFRESEARYRTLFESMNEGCCILEKVCAAANDAIDFQLVEANPAFADHLDGPVCIGKSINQSLPNESAIWLEVCEQVLMGDHPVKFEMQLFSQQREFEISVFRIKDQLHGRVAILLTDITERKRVEAAEREATSANERLGRLEAELRLATVTREASDAVRTTEQRFKAFMDQNPAAAFIKDEEGRYVFVNRTLELRFARPLNEWLGKTDFDLFPQGEAEEFSRHELAVLTSKTATQFNESAVETDGRHEYLSFKFPMQDLTGRWFVAGTVFDITKQKLAEEALALNQERLRALAGELVRVEHHERRRLAGILHEDVQQLLVAVQIRAATIESRVREEPFVHDQVLVLIDLLSQAISLIRTLARDLVPLVLHQLGLRAGLEWLAGRFEQQHGLKVEVATDEDADPQSDTLRDEIYHIASELLLNVVKHARTNRAYVTLRKQSGDLNLTVRDEGVGIGPDDTRHQDDSFGLFQIQERLASMGGSLELSSQPGKGVEVVISVPIAANS